MLTVKSGIDYCSADGVFERLIDCRHGGWKWCSILMKAGF